MSHKFAVYLGNLRPTVRPRYLKQSIIQLFTAINISIDRHDVEIFYNDNGKDDPAYAYVDLSTERDQRYVIQTLSDLAPEDTEDFDNFEYDALVIDGENIRVAAKNDKTLKKYGRHKKGKRERRVSEDVTENDAAPERSVAVPHTSRTRTPRNAAVKKRQSKGPYRFANSESKRSPRVREDSDVEDESTTELLQSLRPEKSYQEEWLERMQSGTELERLTSDMSISEAAGPPVLDLPGTINHRRDDSMSGASEAGSRGVGGSARGVGSEPEEDRFFVRGEHVGRHETRTMEFKTASGKLARKLLKNTVGKYVVSFLNSSGGTLMLGVDDNGIACGREFSQKDEDVMRLIIDDVMKGIQPLVMPNLYSVSFIPVQVDGKFGKVKIVEIRVEPGVGDKLYMTKNGDIYVRRDGSVQGPLKAWEVKQWSEGLYHARLSKNEAELEVLRSEQTALRERVQQQTMVETELMEILLTRKKSKVCEIL